MEWKIISCSYKFKLMNKTPLLYYFISIFFFSSVCALFSTLPTTTTAASLDIKFPLTGKSDLHFQEYEKIQEEEEDMISAWSRRYLSGPGSWPPRCTSKCGKCTPCRPVHVPVPPGTPVTAEYYPEAWRCKCGNKLYMP